MAEPWQRAEVSGPVKAILVNSPERASDLLTKFRRSVVCIGPEILGQEREGAIEPVGRICRTIDACVASPSPSILERIGGPGSKVKPWNLLEIANRLRDPAWMGVDDRGQHDMAVLLGFQYYYSWLILSELKSFAYKHLKTFSLDPYYHPHATYSLANYTVKDRWVSFMRSIAESLESKNKEGT